MKKRLITILVMIAAAFGATNHTTQETLVGGFNTMKGFTTLPSTTATDITYEFGVIDIPTERAGAASSSTGYEFGKLLVSDSAPINTASVSVSVASTSAGFAVTVNQSGRVKGCAFDLNGLPTTGTLSVQVQLNGTLQTGKYCKIPRTATFAANGGPDDVSTNETFLEDNITFVAGDRLGLIASSSNLNAATLDGWAKLILQLQN